MRVLLKFIVLLYILFFTVPCFALTITHPEQNNMSVTEDGIFFSGKIGKFESVSINGIKICPQKYGAFSHSFKLSDGDNVFNIQKRNLFFNTKTIKYNITKKPVIPNKNSNKFISEKSCYYETGKDNVILRRTPVDGGINRLGYLPQNTKLFIDGRFNEFSRVYLSKNNFGWVMTKDIMKSSSLNDDFNCLQYCPKKLLNKDKITTDNDVTYIYTLSEDVPYSAIAENNKLVIVLYNLDEKNEVYRQEFNLDIFPRYSVCMKNRILYVSFKKNFFQNHEYKNNNVKVVIDAGHGGSELGAVGCLSDKEKDINLKIALKLKKILEKNNFDVYLTRDCDKFVSLNDRVDFAKEKDALIFISIHLNSVSVSSDPNLSSGTVVFYYNPQSEELAKNLTKCISEGLNTKNGGVKQASFAVIRPSEYIGVLAEIAYLVNPNDVCIYKSKSFEKNTAKSIYNGLVNYINSQIKQ